MKELAKEYTGVTVLRVFTYLDDVCLAVRDPFGMIEPTQNLASSEDLTKTLRAVEDLGNLNEEKIAMVNFSYISQVLTSLVVCKNREWEEYRYRAKFVSLANTDKPTNPTRLIVSKWFYEVNVYYKDRVGIPHRARDSRKPGRHPI